MKLTVGLRVQSDLKSNRFAEHAPRVEDPGSSAVQLCQDSQGGSMQAGDSRSSSSRLFRWPGRRPAHAAPPEAIPEVPTAAESGPSIAREEGDGFPSSLPDQGRDPHAGCSARACGRRGRLARAP